MNGVVQPDGHRARCLPHVRLVRMLASDEEEALLPRLAQAEAALAMEAILAEVRAEIRALSRNRPGYRDLLGARLSRLTAAAVDAIAAARAGDFARLRRQLRRFDTLTTAIWVVQDAVSGPPGPAGRRPASGHPGRPGRLPGEGGRGGAQ
jgi:hypothetical protein